MVLGGDDPISAYYARMPNEYLSDIQPAFVEPNNELIAKHQLLAMMLDNPLEYAEASKYDVHINHLVQERLVVRRKGRVEVANPSQVRKMLSKYSIRGIGNSVTIRYQNRVLGDRVLPIAVQRPGFGKVEGRGVCGRSEYF